MEELKCSVLKTFQYIVQHIIDWNETIESILVILSTLKSLSDQLDCIVKSPECELTNSYPELRKKLQQTVKGLIEDELSNLSSLMNDLSSANNRLKNVSDVSSKLFLKHFAAIQHEESLYSGSSLEPSVSSMMEWIDDINMNFSNKFLSIKYQLDLFESTPDSVANFTSVCNSVKASHYTDPILAKMHNFINTSVK